MSESLDRNKTVDTHVATATVAAWLDALGCKPVETEGTDVLDGRFGFHPQSSPKSGVGG